MKKTPLKRKSPLKRESKRRGILRALTAPQRRDFIADVAVCMICGMAPAEQCHEIARGPAREAALLKPRLQMGVCGFCHTWLDDMKEWPLAKQVSVRILWELKQTVKELNEVRGRAQTAVTVEEVLEYLT